MALFRTKEIQVTYPPEHVVIQRFYENPESPDDVLLRMKALEFSCRSGKLTIKGDTDNAHEVVDEAEEFFQYMKNGTVPAATERVE